MTAFWILLAVLVVAIAALTLVVGRRDRGRRQSAEPAAQGHPAPGIPAKRDSGLDGGSI